jgi:hypothetical protein
MDPAIEILTTEICLQNERIADLEHALEASTITLYHLRSQLLRTYPENSLIITMVNNSLKKKS